MTLREKSPQGDIVLRPLRRRDEKIWMRLRAENTTWLEPWEPTDPQGQHTALSFPRYVRNLTRSARSGSMLPFAVDFCGGLVGQVTVSAMMSGSLRGGTIGYWLSRHAAGHNVMPYAVAMVTDYCLLTLNMHRLEINIRPGNVKSLRVVAKLGYRDEGIRQRYLHINGQWRDHRSFALTSEDAPLGVLARLQQLGQ